jgi:ABC-type Fe3+/spermidine/putrescine transport system ATPase subunit
MAMTAEIVGTPATASASDPEIALAARALKKDYGRVPVLKSVDLDVRRGEFLTLLGPSGSGKTTLLKLIAGFETPTGGSLLLEGRDITRLAPSQRGIGMVFQNYALFPHMSVADNIAYGLRLRRWSAERRMARVREMLEMISLGHLADRKPTALSGGQQQRVALARALAYSPKLLLMDEPLGALDRWLRLQMEDELRRVHRTLGTTIIYVTHDQEEALVLSDRVAIVNEGVLAALDTPSALYRNPPNAFAARFFSSANVLELPARYSDGFVSIYQAGDTVRLPYAGERGVDGKLALSIRPRSFTLAAPALADGLTFTGTVEDICLLGDDVRIDVHTPDSGTLRVLDDSPAAHNVRIGDSTTIFAPATHITLF